MEEKPTHDSYMWLTIITILYFKMAHRMDISFHIKGINSTQDINNLIASLVSLHMLANILSLHIFFSTITQIT